MLYHGFGYKTVMLLLIFYCIIYLFQNITSEKACKSRIKTARLPIDEYMEKIPQESHSKVLAVNQGKLTLCMLGNFHAFDVLC